MSEKETPYNRFDKYLKKVSLKTRNHQGSYKPSGRSLLLLELLDKVSRSDIILSSCVIVQWLDVVGCSCFFAGDSPGSGSSVLRLLAAVSLCFLGT